MKTKIDLCLEIIQNSDDGNKLAPWQLKLTENAINGFLNKKGFDLLSIVHEQVLKNDFNYSSDVFMKLFVDKVPITDAEKYITYDQNGYVYYKNNCIEHYNDPERSLLKDREELYQKAHHLEKLGFAVNTRNMVWRWDWIEKLTSEDPFVCFVQNFHDLYKKENYFLFFVNDLTFVTYNTITGEKNVTHLDSLAPETNCHRFAVEILKFPYCCIGQEEHQGQIFAPMDKVKEFWKQNNLPIDLFIIS
jgi:hypothetical protein